MPTEVYTEAGLRVLWVPRSEWGASAATEAYIKARPQLTLTSRTKAFVHHTAAVDGSDSTPNSWEYPHAQAYMKALQTVRPDLGPLPYPENVAVSEDGESVWLFEGRGLTARPAHATNHNGTALAWGIFGNFDQLESWDGMRRALRAIRWRAWDLRTNGGFVNMGNVKNPNGWDFWGHRDDSTKSCPGNYVYPLLPEYPFVKWSPDQEDDEDMDNITATSGKFWIVALQRLTNIKLGLKSGDAKYVTPNGVWSTQLRDNIAAAIPDTTPDVVGGNDFWSLAEAVFGTGDDSTAPHNHDADYAALGHGHANKSNKGHTHTVPNTGGDS